MHRINFIVDALIAMMLIGGAAGEVDAQTQTQPLSRTQLTQPIYRVAKFGDRSAARPLPTESNFASQPARTQPEPTAQPPAPRRTPPTRPQGDLLAQGPAAPQPQSPPAHPLDPTLKMAKEALVHIQRNIRDYTGKMLKRETIDGNLSSLETTSIKIRNRKVVDGRTVVPFSIYMTFLSPTHKKGEEGIWVEGRNNNKIVGHGTGFKGFFTVYLDPDGPIATRGTNYRVYDSGLERLVEQLIERAEMERKFSDIQVKYYRNAKLDNRSCTVIELIHPKQSPQYDFHIGRIFVDDEYKVPVRYAAYGWPTAPGAKPPLIEEFTYLDLKLNVGLTDRDFDPKNPEYSYPAR